MKGGLWNVGGQHIPHFLVGQGEWDHSIFWLSAVSALVGGNLIPEQVFRAAIKSFL